MVARAQREVLVVEEQGDPVFLIHADQPTPGMSWSGRATRDTSTRRPSISCGLIVVYFRCSIGVLQCAVWCCIMTINVGRRGNAGRTSTTTHPGGSPMFRSLMPARGRPGRPSGTVSRSRPVSPCWSPGPPRPPPVHPRPPARSPWSPGPPSTRRWSPAAAPTSTSSSRRRRTPAPTARSSAPTGPPTRCPRRRPAAGRSGSPPASTSSSRCPARPTRSPCGTASRTRRTAAASPRRCDVTVNGRHRAAP